jgi:hypothetical protein
VEGTDTGCEAVEMEVIFLDQLNRLNESLPPQERRCRRRRIRMSGWTNDLYVVGKNWSLGRRVFLGGVWSHDERESPHSLEDRSLVRGEVW